MNLYDVKMPEEYFNPSEDKIALMLHSFTVKKKMRLLEGKYVEPYFVSIAVPEIHNPNDAEKIEVLTPVFPNIAINKIVELAGNGILLYGPKNPGEYLQFTILAMECNRDIKEVGKSIQSFVDNYKKTIPTIVANIVNPTVGIAVEIAGQLADALSKHLTALNDDQLYRISGTLFRDIMNDDQSPYHIHTPIEDGNVYIDMKINVLPIPASVSLPKAKNAILQHENAVM